MVTAHRSSPACWSSVSLSCKQKNRERGRRRERRGSERGRHNTDERPCPNDPAIPNIQYSFNETLRRVSYSTPSLCPTTLTIFSLFRFLGLRGLRLSHTLHSLCGRRGLGLKISRFPDVFLTKHQGRDVIQGYADSALTAVHSLAMAIRLCSFSALRCCLTILNVFYIVSYPRNHAFNALCSDHYCSEPSSFNKLRQ